MVDGGDSDDGDDDDMEQKCCSQTLHRKDGRAGCHDCSD